MKFSTIPLAQTIVQLCFAKEIKHIVICPGSRNAPLTISFTENSYFNVYSIIDERSAAFFAMGIAQQTGHPAAVVCTSGSAVLNFYPAIAEAFYSDIPLIVISADRPQKFIDIGDGQTIRQENVFENHILYSANLKEEKEHQIYNETQINIAVNTAIELNGPVHINAPFEEPLYQKTDDLTVRPQHVPVRNFISQNIQNKEEIIDIWNHSQRILILVGVLKPNSLEQKIIETLAENPKVLVLTETTSNLHHKNFINAIDQLINSLSKEENIALQPDLLVTFGGMVVSKKVKVLLRNYPPKHHWHIDAKKAYDTYFCLSQHFKMNVSAFFSEILPETLTSKSDYQSKWLDVKRFRQSRHTAFCETVPFSDFKAFETIFKTIPNEIILQMSNSATIRYAQLFSLKNSLEVYCNRGTSGIDGSTSTAVGAAVVSEKSTVFITGDLSFFYDVNALWNNYIPKNFKIIVINNFGGGIFRILPGEKDTKNFDAFFETIHNRNAQDICRMHGILYHSAFDEIELEQKLNTFFTTNNQPQLLEIFTPRKENDAVLKKYFDQL